MVIGLVVRSRSTDAGRLVRRRAAVEVNDYHAGDGDQPADEQGDGQAFAEKEDATGHRGHRHQQQKTASCGLTG